MSRINYYDTLEEIARLSSRAVFLSCGECNSRAREELLELRSVASGQVCLLEERLFSEFMPPLDRADIAACAHSLSHNIDDALELFFAKTALQAQRRKKSKEAEICLRLSEMIEAGVASLRRLRRPEELPDLVGARALLFEGRVLHAKACRSLGGRLGYEGYLSALERLRRGLGRSFDRLVEVMLSSI